MIMVGRMAVVSARQDLGFGTTISGWLPPKAVLMRECEKSGEQTIKVKGNQMINDPNLVCS